MGESARAAVELVVLLAGCVQPPDVPSGMSLVTPRAHDRDPSLLELARASPAARERSLVAVYPKSACSGSASAVVVDGRGRFLGAVGPGQGALLTVPRDMQRVLVFSSVEVTAPVGTWHDARVVSIPKAPSGLLIRATRFSARECDTGAYFDVELASKAAIETELGEAEISWLAVNPHEGQTWLDAHAKRIAEIATTPPSHAPGDLSHLVLR